MGLLVKAGGTADPEGLAGLTSFVSVLLDQGTKRRNATQIADDLGRIGASFRTSVDYDYTYLAISGLSVSANDLLANLEEFVTQPSFPDAEIKRVREQSIASMQRNLDNPRAVAELGLIGALYGKHPYGRPVSGVRAELGAVTKKNVIQQYLKFYRPNNATLVVVGKFDGAFEKKVETTFGAWAKREVPKVALETPKAAAGLRVRVVEKPDLTQAQIRIAGIGIKRQDPDFLALRMANTILGGAFASRLNDKIRKELGLTYSISSSFDSRIERGPFEISTFTKVESIDKVVNETIKLYRKFISDGVTSEELARSKGYLKGIFPQAIETSDKLGFNLVLLRLYGIPDRYLTHYVHDLDALSVSQVNSAIRRSMRPDDLTIVVHAPKASAESLKALSPQYEVIPVTALQ
jgi:zinc protease